MLSDLIEHCTKPAMPAELRRLADTLKKWFENPELPPRPDQLRAH